MKADTFFTFEIAQRMDFQMVLLRMSEVDTGVSQVVFFLGVSVKASFTKCGIELRGADRNVGDPRCLPRPGLVRFNYALFVIVLTRILGSVSFTPFSTLRISRSFRSCWNWRTTWGSAPFSPTSCT